MAEVFLPSDNPNSQFARVVDLSKGAQQGAMTDPSNWTHSAYYPRPHVQAFLVSAPKGFKYLPDGAGMIKRLKVMVETKAKSISGLVSSLTVESDEVLVDKGSDAIQIPLKVTRERSNPNMVWNEYRGMPIWKDLSSWVINLIEDPMTGRPGVIAMQSYIDDGSPELTADYYSMTVMFAQFSQNMTSVDMSWMCSNMYPQGVEFEGGMEYGSPLELVEHAIDFSALTLHGDQVKAVNQMALDYLGDINKAGFSPSGLTPFVAGIDSNLLSNAINSGYKEGVNKIADNL